MKLYKHKNRTLSLGGAANNAMVTLPATALSVRSPTPTPNCLRVPIKQAVVDYSEQMRGREQQTSLRKQFRRSQCTVVVRTTLRAFRNKASTDKDVLMCLGVKGTL